MRAEFEGKRGHFPQENTLNIEAPSVSSPSDVRLRMTPLPYQEYVHSKSMELEN